MPVSPAKFHRWFLAILLSSVSLFAAASSDETQASVEKLSDAPKLAFSEEERQWLRDHPVLRTAADPTWAPIEYRDRQGRYQGIGPDYIDALSHLLGVRFEYVDGPWAKLIQLGQQGQIDVFVSLAKTASREQYYLFTSPYASYPVGIFTRDNIHYVRGLDDLKGKRLAVCRGYAAEEWLRSNHANLDIVSVESIPEGLGSLERGDVDAFVENRLSATYYARQLGYLDLRAAGDSRYAYETCLAVPRDRAVLLSILEKALQAIPTDRQEAIYAKWANLSDDREFDYSPLWKALGTAAVIVALFAYWNRRLAREVARRTKDLSYAYDLQKALFDQTFQFIGLLAPDGTTQYANRTVLDFAGVSEAEVIGKPLWDTPWWQHDATMQERLREAVARAAVGEVVRFEATHRDAHGTLHDVDFSLKPMRDATGAIVCLIPEGRDVTEARQAEAARGESEELYRSLFENAGKRDRHPEPGSVRRLQRNGSEGVRVHSRTAYRAGAV